MPPPKVAASSIELPLVAGFVADDAAIQTVVLTLFDECVYGLRRYVMSFGLSHAASDDVVQETYLALFRHLYLGRPDDHLKGWLYRVAHNLALKERQRMDRWHGADPEQTGILALIDPAENPEERLAGEQRRRRLRAVARALPERERRCLHLRAEGLTYRDITDVLGVSLGTVAKSLARAFARLARSESP